MLFENISVMLPDGSLARNRYVTVEGEFITAIGEQAPAGYEGERYDGTGKCLLPGFVNTHCHVPMTILRGYGEGLSLHDWLFTRIFPFEAKLTGEDVYWASLLGIAEMLRSGVTSFSDMYYECERMLQAVQESGIKSNISWGISSQEDTSFEQNHRYNRVCELLKFNDPTGRARFEGALHAEYTCNPGLVRSTAAFAKEHGMRMQIHLSETRSEHEECIGRHGKTPAQFFEDLGVFENPTIAAHCVWVSDEDIEILRRNQVTVAHCPTSNLKLASGFAPIWKMHQEGVRVSIGTDGASSNNNLNMLEELTLAALLQKATTGDPTVMGPGEVLRMASRNGALAQGREDCGEIAAGRRADLIVVDLEKPHLQPQGDDLCNIVHAASAEDICLTMVDGEVVCKNGVCLKIDLERVVSEVNASKQRILKSL